MRPMLAATADAAMLNMLKYPVICSPKLDGIRCLAGPGGSVLSRSLKDIPNKHIRRTLQSAVQSEFWLDGELMLRDTNNFQEIASAVMTEDSEPDFVYHIFDMLTGDTYQERVDKLQAAFSQNLQTAHTALVPTVIAITSEEVIELQSVFLSQGYEGLMLRSPNGLYKYGRSTLKEQGLIKFKNFSDSEAVILAYDQRMHNANEAKTDELGLSKRSSHKENMVPVEELGTLFVKDLETGIEFGIGSGFTQQQRKDLWLSRDTLAGKIVKYKYFAIGIKEAPRFPVFLGFRDERDMSK